MFQLIELSRQFASKLAQKYRQQFPQDSWRPPCSHKIRWQRDPRMCSVTPAEIGSAHARRKYRTNLRRNISSGRRKAIHFVAKLQPTSTAADIVIDVGPYTITDHPMASFFWSTESENDLQSSILKLIFILAYLGTIQR